MKSTDVYYVLDLEYQGMWLDQLGVLNFGYRFFTTFLQ